MLRHFYKVLLRYLLGNKLYTFINICGLSLGLACCIVLSLFVLGQTGYDSYHENREQIYRLSLNVERLDGGDSTQSPITSFLWGPALIQDYPEIDAYLRIYQTFSEQSFDVEGTGFSSDRFVYADGNLFSFFTWELVAGDPQTVLSEPYSVVISESVAKSYFADGSALGKTLLTYDSRLQSPANPEGVLELTITGIMRDVPHKSHLKPSMVASFSTLNDIFDANVVNGEAPVDDFWRARNTHTFLQLNPQSRPEILEQKLSDFVSRYLGDSTTSRGYVYDPYLQNISTLHLDGPLIDLFDEGGNKEQIAICSIIALLILAVACINFMNLTTAQSIKRASEIGIRKVSGAGIANLAAQFLGESVLLTFLALGLALVIVEFVNPVFYSYIGAEFHLSPEDIPYALSGGVVLAVVVGIISGLYPAFIMASVKTVNALQTRFAVTGKGRMISKGLVILQFAFSIFFVCTTAVVYQQRHFMVMQDIGAKTEDVVITPLFGQVSQTQIEVIRNELMGSSGIEAVTVSNGIPGFGRSGDIWGEPNSTDGAVSSFEQSVVDYDYLDFFELELLAGRDFDRNRSTDAAPEEVSGSGFEMAAIINESAVRRLGWNSPEEALGRRLVRDPASPDFTVSVIGVVRDFHIVGLQNEIAPQVLFINAHDDPGFRLLSVELQPQDITEGINRIREVMTPFIGDESFEYYFLDEYFENRWYQSEQRLIEIFSYVAFFTILVACLGLLGLATFSTEQRTKEIGVRKVMGGSIMQIVMLLTNDFSKLVLISNVIAWPVAYYAMYRWLEGFAYRIDLSPLIFIGSGAIALCIAWVTVGGTAARAARQKPVLALRYE